jgi:tRNA modification GTPase
MTDTIYALATAPGRAAVAVVRLSGPATRGALDRIGARSLRPRRASLRTLRDDMGDMLDQALALWFPGPESYTGEDCAELHLHGGAAVVEGVMRAIGAAGARLAEPGEFTRRAFQNGKFDLGQAEAVADLVDAQTAAQARQAIAQLKGALGVRYQGWRATLLETLAGLEAAVDFPDEEIPEDVAAESAGPLDRLILELDEALTDGARGRQVREGYRVAIVGSPNAGKSTLFNALTGREMAIVTPAPGTTRDVIEAPVVWGGFQVILADMAGLRDAVDLAEVEGVRRAQAWANSADLRLWVIDRGTLDGDWRRIPPLMRVGDAALANKADLTVTDEGLAAMSAASAAGLELRDTSLTGPGASEVRAWLETRVVKGLVGSEFPATTRDRHARHLCAAKAHLVRARESLARPELAAEDVRLAARRLAAVTGAIGVEDVLGQVFARFCIGK